MAEEEVVVCRRVGVQSTTPYRWYLLGCKSVSKRDRIAEKLQEVGKNDETKATNVEEDKLVWRGQDYGPV